MEYYSAFYWQQEEADRASLVLKHLVYHEKGMSVILGCICVDESTVDGGMMGETRANQWTDRLTEWFYEKGLKLCYKASGISKELEKALNRLLKKTAGGLSVTGVICVGNAFVLFGQGIQRIGLLNTGFGRAHCKYVEKEGEAYIVVGSMQKGVGILLATESFYLYLSDEELTECLAVKDLQTAQRVQRHMDELGQEASRQGGQQLGALLVVSC